MSRVQKCQKISRPHVRLHGGLNKGHGNSKILITRQLKIIGTRYLAYLFVSITPRSVNNFIFLSQLLTLTLILTLTFLNRALRQFGPLTKHN